MNIFFVFSLQVCTPKWPADSLGFAFAGSAYSILYYFGVVDSLVSTGILDPQIARMGGLSGGAWTSMATCAGVSAPDLFSEFSTILTACNAKFNNKTDLLPCQGELWTNSQTIAKVWFPNDTSASFKKCSKGRVRVAITQVNPNNATMDTNSPRVINKFKSAQDLRE